MAEIRECNGEEQSPDTMSESIENGQVAVASQADVSDETEGLDDQVEQQQQPQQQPATRMETFFSITKTLIVRALIMYFIVSMFRRSTPQMGSETGQQGSKASRVLAANVYQDGFQMDLYVYLSEEEKFKDFNNSEKLMWLQEGLMYGDWKSGPTGDGVYLYKTQFETSEIMRNNGSIYIHVFIVRHGKSPDPSTGKTHYSKKYTIYRSKRLNRFKRMKYTRTQNLLTGETAATQKEIEKAESAEIDIVSHWHPNVTINLVNDFTGWTRGGVPPPLDEYIDFLPSGQHYRPILYLNDYWNLNKEFTPINDTVTVLNLTVTYQPLSLFRWQLYTAQSMHKKWTSNLLGESLEEGEEDQDALKEAFLDTSPYLLVLTVVISIVHSVFEFLAFKNDIQFWNNRKSLEGLSVRSVFFNVFQSLTVLLYVLDNEANTVVKISCFIGLVIEIWKIHKVMDVKIDYERKLLGLLPYVTLKDKGSYVESSTKIYDRMAFKYLSWVLFPLLGGYAVYSLLYLEHKGWYSWILSMLYGFLLTFGFIMMTPQLFINYKLKSVAHLPWRMLTYKALNTFIDDIFAFVIKMPTMYRIGCFRDDIVFFIFLYQKYIYRIDPSRINEFGFSAEMEREAADKKQQANGAVPIEEKPKAVEAKKND